MLRRLLPLTVLIPATLLVTTMTHADATADAKKAIATNYAKMAAATNKKDVDGMVAFFAPDRVLIAKDGRTLTLEQEKQQARAMISSVKSIKYRVQIINFKLKANMALATTKGHAELEAINPQNNQSVKILIDGSSEETWVKSGAKWLEKKIQRNLQDNDDER